jgi:hypothetical protein
VRYPYTKMLAIEVPKKNLEHYRYTKLLDVEVPLGKE